MVKISHTPSHYCCQSILMGMCHSDITPRMRLSWCLLFSNKGFYLRKDVAELKQALVTPDSEERRLYLETRLAFVAEVRAVRVAKTHWVILFIVLTIFTQFAWEWRLWRDKQDKLRSSERSAVRASRFEQWVISNSSWIHLKRKCRIVQRICDAGWEKELNWMKARGAYGRLEKIQGVNVSRKLTNKGKCSAWYLPVIHALLPI